MTKKQDKTIPKKGANLIKNQPKVDPAQPNLYSRFLAHYQLLTVFLIIVSSVLIIIGWANNSSLPNQQSSNAATSSLS